MSKRWRVFHRVGVWTGAVFLLFAFGCAGTEGGPWDDPTATPFNRLCNGNARFSSGAIQHPHADRGRRLSTLEHGQHPYATVLTCSDSRVMPEMIFDAGIGDLFVIRVAGHVCAADETGSIEYAVDHLGTPLLVVMGHESCGAVTAACHHAREHGEIPEILSKIEPSVRAVEQRGPWASDAAMVSAAVRENVVHTIAELTHRSESVRMAMASGRLRVLGSVYDLRTGRVTWLDEQPRRSDDKTEIDASATASIDECRRKISPDGR